MVYLFVTPAIALLLILRAATSFACVSIIKNRAKKEKSKIASVEILIMVTSSDRPGDNSKIRKMVKQIASPMNSYCATWFY